MMYGVSIIVEMLASNPFVEVEKWSEEAYYLTVGSPELVGTEAEEEAENSMRTIIQTAKKLGFYTENYEEYECTYTLFNGVARIYVELGTYEAMDL